MATGSVLASTAGYAYADAGAVGTAAESPGVGSGNNVQVPIDVPVNVCGNTINVVGLLNPAMGNNCANGSQHGGSKHGGPQSGGSQSGGSQSGDSQSGGSQHGTPWHGGAPAAGSQGGASHSPGVGAGNTVQAPIGAPVNLCGDSASVIGLANPAFGNQCATHGGGGGTPAPPEHCSCTPPPNHGHPQPPPPKHSKPPVTPPAVHHNPPPPPPAPARATPPTQAVLASTGADAGTLLLAPAGAAMALGGLLLYRRSRVAQR
ncbi:chaplin [Streptacidiphilus sp. PAMC 29251]